MPCHPATYMVGTVTDAVSHRPISDAVVRLYFYEIRTARSGCFALGGADGLPFEFRVSAPGYKPLVAKAVPGSYRTTVMLISESNAGVSSSEPRAISREQYAEFSQGCR